MKIKGRMPPGPFVSFVPFCGYLIFFMAGGCTPNCFLADGLSLKLAEADGQQEYVERDQPRQNRDY